jgi:hypothetical protein
MIEMDEDRNLLHYSPQIQTEFFRLAVYRPTRELLPSHASRLGCGIRYPFLF